MRRTPALVLLLVAASCGGRSAKVEANVAGFGGSTNEVPPSAGDTGQAGSAGSGDNAAVTCETGAPFAVERRPGSSLPVIMFVLDASAATTVTAPSGGSVWDNTAGAVNDVVGVLPDGLPFGAFSFPDLVTQGQHVCPTMVRAWLAPLDQQKRLELRNALDGVGQPYGPRDLEQAYKLALTPPWSAPASEHEALVVVTTGLPTHDLECQPFDGTPTREDIAPLFDAVEQARASGIDTYVIGSYGSTAVRDVLSELALAAGTAEEPCKDQGADDYCHLDISWSNDVRGQLDVALWVAVNHELERSGCRLTLPSFLSAPSSLSLVSAAGTVPLGSSSGEVRCQDGWAAAPLASNDGEASAAISLCTATCFDYLADPTAQIVACATVAAPHL